MQEVEQDEESSHGDAAARLRFIKTEYRAIGVPFTRE